MHFQMFVGQLKSNKSHYGHSRLCIDKPLRQYIKHYLGALLVVYQKFQPMSVCKPPLIALLTVLSHIK